MTRRAARRSRPSTGRTSFRVAFVLRNAEPAVPRAPSGAPPPRQHLLRRICRDQDLCRTRECDPLTDVRSERARLPTSVGSRSGRLELSFARGDARCREAEPLEDPSRLVRREVGAVEPGHAREDLLRRVAPPADDDVVLVDRVGQDACDGVGYGLGREVEAPSGHAMSGHVLRLSSLIRLSRTVAPPALDQPVGDR